MGRLIGFCGPHRTGKTTLAKQLAGMVSGQYIDSSATPIFAKLGLNPANVTSWKDRMQVQRTLLAHYEELWSVEDGIYVTDRTPLDLAMYTASDLHMCPDDQYGEWQSYHVKCLQLTHHLFRSIISVSPGIPIQDAPGKAAPSRALQQKLDFVLDSILRAPLLLGMHIARMPWNCVTPEHRRLWLEQWLAQSPQYQHG